MEQVPTQHTQLEQAAGIALLAIKAEERQQDMITKIKLGKVSNKESDLELLQQRVAIRVSIKNIRRCMGETILEVLIKMIF
jgi:hypothetical protein